MDYSTLANLTRQMLENILPTKDAIDANVKEAIHFWGNDTEGWMITEDQPPVHFNHSEAPGPSFSLVNKGIAARDEFIAKVNTDQLISKYVHPKSIEKLLETLLRTSAATETITDEELSELIKKQIIDLRNSIVEWEGLAPTAYLIFKDFTNLVIGKTEFKPSSEMAILFIKEINERIAINDSEEHEKEATKKALLDMFSPELSESPICARVVVKAESSKVRELVEEEVELSLHLLRCYAPVLFPRDLRIGIGLLHQNGYYFRPVIGFSKSDPSWTVHMENVGVQQQYELTQERLEHLRKIWAFDELNNILAKEQSERSKLEKLIVTTIRWLGCGVVETDNANKVLHFAAASESLIMGQKSEGEITEKFSRRLSFLIGKTPADRKYLFVRCKKLYKLRSSVIHSGSINIDPADVAGLEIITLQALVEMAKRSLKWKTHEEFLAWCEDEISGIADSGTES